MITKKWYISTPTNGNAENKKTNKQTNIRDEIVNNTDDNMIIIISTVIITTEIILPVRLWR